MMQDLIDLAIFMLGAMTLCYASYRTGLSDGLKIASEACGRTDCDQKGRTDSRRQDGHRRKVGRTRG